MARVWALRPVAVLEAAATSIAFFLDRDQAECLEKLAGSTDPHLGGFEGARL